MPPLPELEIGRVISSLIQSGVVSSAVFTQEEFGPADLDRELQGDSLERLVLASRVAHMFHLHEAGVQEYLVSYSTLREWVQVVRFALTEGTGRISFQTSGSTSVPVVCTHHISTLEQEISELKALFSQVRRIVALVPSHHIYGFLFTALLPSALEVPVIDGRRRSLPDLTTSFVPGDLVIGSPFHWLHIDRICPRLPAGVAGVSSGGPCSEGVRSSFLVKGVALTDVYGSSETGGVGWRQRAEIPFRLFSYWSHHDANLLRRHMPDGGVAEYAIPDRLDWIDDQTFTVSGRQDGVVQVAGMNVAPELIAARIKTHPAVSDCVVRLMRADEGERLKVFVIWKPELDSLRDWTAELENWLRENFRSHERPASINAGPELPRNAHGKLTDW